MGMGGQVTLMVGPSLEKTALQIVGRAVNDAGAGNANFERATLQVNNRLVGGYAAYWFLGVRGGVMRPFILQRRLDPELQDQVTPESDSVFNRNEVAFGVRARHNVGYGWWHMVVGSTGT